MKKMISLLLFILIASISVNSVEIHAKEKFEYSVKAGTKEWKDMKTRHQLVESTRIPNKVLKAMSTEELVEAVFDYPLLINLLLFNTDDDALKQFEKDSDAYKELLKRQDASMALNVYVSFLKEDEIIKQKASEVLFESKELSKISLSIGYRIMYPNYAYSIGYVYTPNGNGVFVIESDKPDLTVYEITMYREGLEEVYPNATYSRDSDVDYNCHSYAWYSTSSYNDWWMQEDYDYYGYSDEPGLMKYMTDGSYTRTYSAYQASRVYFPGIHSMKIYDAYSNSIYNATLISKWGEGPVMIHAVDYSPYDHVGYKMYK